MFLTGTVLFCFHLTSAQEQSAPPPQQIPPLKVEVQLVNVTATVEDRDGRPRTGLNREDFQVWEDGVRQQISFFHDDEHVPVSVGILFDTSGSMIDKIDEVQDAVIHFIDTTNPEDDIFIVQFSQHASLVEEFTGDRQRLRGAIGCLRAGGGTALYEAIVQGLEHLQSGKYKKKALLLITDGNDTTSLMDIREAVGTAQHSESIIYALGIGHGERGSFGHLEGGFKDTVDVDVLRQFTDVTGGKTILVQGAHRRGGVDLIDLACQQVGAELRGQYTIAYYPSNKSKDGSYRRVKISVITHPEYAVRSRQGYYAPKN